MDIDICGPSIARMMGVENENVRPTSTGWTPVYTTNGYEEDETDADNDIEENEISLAVMSIAFLLQSKDDAVIWYVMFVWFAFSNDYSLFFCTCIKNKNKKQTQINTHARRGPRKNGLIRQFLCDVTWNELDFLIIDSPPGTSDEHISIQKFLSTISQRQKKVHSIIVSTPQEVSLLDVRKEVTFCNKVKLPILGIIGMCEIFLN